MPMFTLRFSTSTVIPSKMSLSSETVDTLTEDNNTAAEDRGQGQSNQGQKEEGEEEVQQRFSYEVDPDIGVIV